MSLWQRLHIARLQLGWGEFFKYVISGAVKRALDPYLIPSYSQFGEDRLIDNYFGDHSQGFYVDVGCNHPIAYSNTWKLYLRGWHGIAIDANRPLNAHYQITRPRDNVITCVVSDSPQPVDFYFSSVSSLISGVGSKSEGPWQRTEDNARFESCIPRSLTEILDTCAAPSAFELLSVDVEGHELEVLNSLDFVRYQPMMLLVEIHELDLSEPDSDPVYRKLVTSSYRLIGYISCTAVFLRNDPTVTA